MKNDDIVLNFIRCLLYFQETNFIRCIFCKLHTSMKTEAIHQQEQESSDIYEISIWLDAYDDIFSSFDSRPLSERTVSDDFLSEVKKVCDEKSRNKIHLKLAMPENLRNEHDEKLIIKRLHVYFKNCQQTVKTEVKNKNLKGIFYIVFGAVLMLFASYISYNKPEKFAVHAMVILSEPASWFFIWTGLEHFHFSRNNKKDVSYFDKMADAAIRFVNLK